MGFKAAGQTKPGGQLVRLAEKIDLLRQRPAIVARQQIDKARVEAAGLGEAGLQARQMLLRRFMLGGSTPPPLKRMAIYSSPDACRRSASCRRSATVNGTRASIPQQPTRCSSSSVCGQGSSLPRGCESISAPWRLPQAYFTPGRTQSISYSRLAASWEVLPLTS